MFQHVLFCGTVRTGHEDLLEAVHKAPKISVYFSTIDNLDSTFVSSAACTFDNTPSTGSSGFSSPVSCPTKMSKSSETDRVCTESNQLFLEVTT